MGQFYLLLHTQWNVTHQDKQCNLNKCIDYREYCRSGFCLYIFLKCFTLFDSYYYQGLWVVADFVLVMSGKDIMSTRILYVTV